MARRILALVAWSAVIVVLATPLLAQRPATGPTKGAPQQPGQRKGGNGNTNEVKIEDPRLIELHQQFIQNVEKLALEYEKKGELEKARDCYKQVLRLIPQYTPAADRLVAVQAREAEKDFKKIEILANREWQDTGVIVGEGKPISINAAGTWKIRIDYDLSPDGVEIPKELQAFNIGALVGMIVTNPNAGINDKTSSKGNEPAENPVFMVGSSKAFIANQTGRLFLRMYDADPKDNVGKVSVELKGSFEKAAK